MKAGIKNILVALAILMIGAAPVYAEDKKTEDAPAEEKADAEKPAEETAGSDEKKEDDKSYRFAPDFCDFEVTLPETPVIMKKCIPDSGCFDVNSYTMVYDLQTTVDISVTCNPSTPEAYERYNEAVMKAALAGMVENKSLSTHEVRFDEMKEEKVKSAALTGTGVTGRQEKIYTAQLWIGPNSVFTIQAELIGGAHEKADKSFSDILSSIKSKKGKQIPRPKKTVIPKQNYQYLRGKRPYLFHHGKESVAAVRRQVVRKAKLGKFILDVHRGNFVRRFAFIGGQHDKNEALGDFSIGIRMEMEAARAIFLIIEPNFGHAALHFGGVRFQRVFHRRHLIPEINQILVPPFPVIEEREILNQL